MNPGWTSFLQGISSTPMQRAVIGSLGCLGGIVFLTETGLLGIVAQSIFKSVRVLFRKKGSGVHLGNIFLSDNDRVRHTHIVGSPGSGKTEATKTLIFEDIKQGRGCFIIDAKGDRELYEEVLGCCRSVGREQDLKLLSATYESETSVWNPCGLGSASELQRKFLNSNVYSEAFYDKACELSLLEAFNQLTQAMPDGFGLPELVKDLKYQADRRKKAYIEGL